MQVGILTATSVEEKFRFLSAVTKMACTVVRCDGLSMTCTTRFTCDDRCWLVYTMTHHYWFSHFIFFFLFSPSFTSLLLSSSPLMTVTDQQHLLTSILKYVYIPMSMICWWIVFSHTCTRSAGDCQSREPCTSVLIRIPPVIVRSLLLSPSSFLQLSPVFLFSYSFSPSFRLSASP